MYIYIYIHIYLFICFCVSILVYVYMSIFHKLILIYLLECPLALKSKLQQNKNISTHCIYSGIMVPWSRAGAIF